MRMVFSHFSQFNTIHSKYSNTKTDACQNVPKFTATYPREQANNKLLNQSGPLSDHGLKSNHVSVSITAPLPKVIFSLNLNISIIPPPQPLNIKQPLHYLHLNPF
ncbi:hypothetical protein L13192_12019 [Pyrenophora tritici-repentis]|uniref:Uncharacterized protein n=2 Tax=Pyrenophora tritici-repentis TaxID=45151 RepID=A0A922SSJ9_9PLEO|nr:uncharacterized protein PTRG_06206 [Pyrenophora tritici-repentis Pt-1C-BFP]EDU49126.1 predicted protein [Pyrenophora tritici-repentis Pt-1C-BFP]KAI1509954.1 hypothetical protein Ptr86124_010992 [Pyrenophora tritici-repentis]KAI1664078.1 hypothetical protein L13192_12019 [Pyrenophora tritici-repentis]KAI1683312.1 hypothetical protein KJE20_08044 [Pyrenophora tritici-repentis]